MNNTNWYNDKTMMKSGCIVRGNNVFHQPKPKPYTQALIAGNMYWHKQAEQQQLNALTYNRAIAQQAASLSVVNGQN